MLYWQECPKCGHISTPDCWNCTCHQCGEAKYRPGNTFNDEEED